MRRRAYLTGEEGADASLNVSNRLDIFYLRVLCEMESEHTAKLRRLDIRGQAKMS